MPFFKNLTEEVFTLPTGHVIRGETYVAIEVLAHPDNLPYVKMLLNKGRIVCVGQLSEDRSDSSEDRSDSSEDPLDFSEEE